MCNEFGFFSYICESGPFLFLCVVSGKIRVFMVEVVCLDRKGIFVKDIVYRVQFFVSGCLV